MSGDKSFNININARAGAALGVGLVGAAMGVGLMAGAGTYYLFSRLNEHTRLTHQISNLHTTIMEVKREIALLETGREQKDAVSDEEEELEKLDDRNLVSTHHSPSSCHSSRPSSRSSFRKKTVSFSSTTSGNTSASYHTAPENIISQRASVRCTSESDSLATAVNYQTASGYDTDNSFRTTPGYDTDTSRATDTDYYSPDEDDDEFFDLSPDDSENAAPSISRSPREGHHTSDEEEHMTYLLQQVDQLSEGSGSDQTHAYNLLRGEIDQYSDSPEFLWRLAMATRNMAIVIEQSGNVKDKKEMIFEGYNYAEKAYLLDLNNPQCNKWFGILCGMRGEYLGQTERIKSGFQFKSHLDKALEHMPEDASLHYLLGRFCFEVSQLHWSMRHVGRALYGEIPTSTIEEALGYFQAAENLTPNGWKENRIFLAKCHLQLKNKEMCIQYLELAKEVPIITPDDEAVHKEVLELLQKNS
ncbi:hypothetical protein Pmani_027132 [Petrolisthes manimaculis]|uniref:Regulator of microtubule dynamics protein 3 n=1 Tax=Petrolisthes manimaculis TaxID=1843537 RepID=A0AAE1TW21_9EUCA|nr:hypothetical protein Pmani_027132 [Petrolisthes manimaculis]